MEPRQPRLRRWFLPVFKHVNGAGLETDRLCEAVDGLGQILKRVIEQARGTPRQGQE